MKFENKLIPGIFIKRYKRFFTDIKIKNKIITAHCPNTGSMLGLLNEGNKSWITKSDNKKRKLKYTLQIIKDKKNKIGINTHLTNKIVYEALKNNKIKEIAKKITIKPEQKFGLDTRFDFLITEKNKKSFIEVKNVTLSRKKGLAEFPDAKTSRGIKHLNSLIKSIEQGYCGYLLFVIQREDCKSFSIAKDIDPEYSKLLTIATKKKVKLLCYDCKFSSKGIKLNNRIKIENDE
jgi:sugar fermentation stimulation protein A